MADASCVVKLKLWLIAGVAEQNEQEPVVQSMVLQQLSVVLQS